MKRIDLVGKKFDRLTVISLHDTNNGIARWSCICVCGNTSIVSYGNLKDKHVRSCGCLSKEGNQSKHRDSFTRFYRIWSSMKMRCINKNRDSYKYYGGKGIKICERWFEYMNFKNDMYDSYLMHIKEYGEKNTSLDRMGNNSNYCKENCRWATLREQANNKRNSLFIEYNGERKTLSQWCEVLDINQNTVKQRLHRGWSTDKSFQSPMKNKYVNRS
jgi:hypothetical protein